MSSTFGAPKEELNEEEKDLLIESKTESRGKIAVNIEQAFELSGGFGRF